MVKEFAASRLRSHIVRTPPFPKLRASSPQQFHERGESRVVGADIEIRPELIDHAPCLSRPTPSEQRSRLRVREHVYQNVAFRLRKPTEVSKEISSG
jgi:hypothetical protein